jgi:hypothetical protein
VASIYSTLFSTGDCPASDTITAYTVPTGMVAVLRSVSLVPTGTGSTTMLVVRHGVAVLIGVNATGQFISHHIDMRQVFNAGDVIDVQSIAGDFQYSLSGYLLSA